MKVTWTATPLRDTTRITIKDISPLCYIKEASTTVREPSKKSSFYDDDMLDYLLKDVIIQRAEEAEEKIKAELAERARRKVDNFNDKIATVIFNDPATIIKWKDGTKTVVKCQPGDTYDPEKGLALALVKRQFEDSSYFNTIFKKWLPNED